MSETLAKTALHDWHAEHGGRMVDFAGWSMPVQYTSIVEEHQATRTAAGVFDVSHMGRLRFDGPDTARFLDGLLTRRVADMGIGRIRYSLMTDEQGGILDDVLVYLIEPPSGQQRHLMVVNAGNREKIVAWIQRHLDAFVADGGQVAFSDRTIETAMIAVQGPAALKILTPIIKADLSRMKYYTGVATEQFGRACIVSRTGYTGEDGYEIIARAEDAADVWKNIMRAGRDHDVRAAGLAARDTLRLEAAMPLYGHELSEQINPIQAGLGFAVNLKDRDFIGREAVLKFKEDSEQPRRVGLEMAARRVPREHYPVLADGNVIGEVTSGTFSPTLERPIAMAYVQPSHAELGTELFVDIRGRHEPARVVDLPFYRREKLPRD